MTTPDPWVENLLALIRQHYAGRRYVTVAEARALVGLLLRAAAPYLGPRKMAVLQAEAARLLADLTRTGETRH